MKKIIKSMSAEDLIHLTIKKDGSGWAVYLDEKKLHHVDGYSVESSTLPGAAELSIKMLVRYP